MLKVKKVKYLRNSEIDYKKWDFCINQSVNAKVYAYSWYLDLVASNWDCIVYDDYKLVFPVVFKKYFFVFKTLYQPVFCQQLGPFSSSTLLLKNENILDNIFTILIAKFSKYEFAINHVVCNKLIQNNYLFKKKINFTKRINLELDLSAKYETLYNQYNLNTKRNLKLSQNFSIRELDDVNYFVNSYKSHLNHIVKLKETEYDVMHKIITNCLQKNIGTIQGVFNSKNELLAAYFMIKTLKRHILLFNFSNPKFHKYSPMTYLINNYIMLNSKKLEVLDFEGSNLSGVKRFYKGFGAIEKNYIYIHN